MYIYSWSVKDTVKCCDLKKKWSPLVVREPCAPLTAVQSFSLPRSCRHSGKNAAHSTWITVCLMCHVVFSFVWGFFFPCLCHFCCHMSNPVVVANGKWTHGHNTVNGEYFPALCLELVSCVLSLSLFIFVLVISMQVVRMFSTFQWFVLASIGYEGCCNIHPHLCVTCFSAHGVSSFDILLYLLLLLKKHKKTNKKRQNLWTCILYGVFTIMCLYSVSRLIHRGFIFFIFFLLESEVFLCWQPFLTPEHKIQSAKLAAIYWN